MLAWPDYTNSPPCCKASQNEQQCEFEKKKVTSIKFGFGQTRTMMQTEIGLSLEASPSAQPVRSMATLAPLDWKLMFWILSKWAPKRLHIRMLDELVSLV